jgi:hypothetical protein
MPPLPGFPKNIWGALIGGLANVPALMKIFYAVSRRSLKKTIEENPI